MEKRFLPSPKDEIERYKKHNNSATDEGYVGFLNWIINASLAYLSEGMQCLDYGCGHTPVLSELVRNRGIQCHNYDPLFGIDHPLKKYDCIFSTETFEHFSNPDAELRNIDTMLAEGGYLAIMTEQWESVQCFNAWYYKRDFTHVCFYNPLTMDYIAKHYGYEILYRDRNRVVVMRKRRLRDSQSVVR